VRELISACGGMIAWFKTAGRWRNRDHHYSMSLMPYWRQNRAPSRSIFRVDAKGRDRIDRRQCVCHRASDRLGAPGTSPPCVCSEQRNAWHLAPHRMGASQWFSCLHREHGSRTSCRGSLCECDSTSPACVDVARFCDRPQIIRDRTDGLLVPPVFVWTLTLRSTTIEVGVWSRHHVFTEWNDGRCLMQCGAVAAPVAATAHGQTTTGRVAGRIRGMHQGS